ncbi:hypothetical protein Btru_053306 [Bulinus truncatus]|nr:hypothetical protein Btru_053306 [Bulinus truncatus]
MYKDYSQPPSVQRLQPTSFCTKVTANLLLYKDYSQLPSVQRLQPTSFCTKVTANLLLYKDYSQPPSVQRLQPTSCCTKITANLLLYKGYSQPPSVQRLQPTSFCTKITANLLLYKDYSQPPSVQRLQPTSFCTKVTANLLLYKDYSQPPSVQRLQPTSFRTKVTANFLLYKDYSQPPSVQRLQPTSFFGNIAKLQIINLVKQISIPDLEGNADQIYYSIKNTTVDEVNEPKINIQLTPTESGNNDAALFVSNLSLVVSTDYNVSYSVLNIANLPLSGTVKAVFDQVDIHFKLSLVPDDGYRTVPQSSDCEVNINNFNLLFTGDFSWLLNLLQNIFTGRIKSSIQEQICIYMIQSLDNNGANKTKELQLTSTFADVFVIDYVHTSPIVFADNYMEGGHLGEVYWKAGRKASPLTSSPLPEFQVDNTRMVYILLSDYPAETLTYVAHSEGYLQYTLTADKNLPPVGVQHLNGHQQLTLADFLRTTCSDRRCVGSIIPELGTKYPQSYVKVDLKSNQTPSVQVTSDVISVILYGNVDLSVHVRADDYLNFLSLQVVLTLTATPYIKDGRLSASILQYSQQVKNVTFNSVSENEISANEFIQSSVDNIIIPQMKRIASIGLPLPSLGGVKLVNSSLTLLNGAVLISSDAIFKGSIYPDIGVFP